MRIPFLRPKPEAPAAKPSRSRSKPPPVDDPADIEAARTQARRRLVGALVLLVIGVVGFPVLFETQPRPLPMDTPIVAPRREAVASGQVLSDSAGSRASAVPMLPADAGNETATSPAPAAPAAPAASATAAATPASAARAEKVVAAAVTVPAASPKAPAASQAAVTPGRSAAVPAAGSSPTPAPAPSTQAAQPAKSFTVSTAGGPAVVAPPAAKPMAQAAPIAAASSPARPAPVTPVPSPAPKVAAAVGTVATASSSAAASAAAATARYVVQAGAYSEAGKLREARAKIEGLGLKTYTQVIEGDGGSRTRVRVGPFNNKAEAEAVAAKIKRGGVPAAVLAL